MPIYALLLSIAIAVAFATQSEETSAEVTGVPILPEYGMIKFDKYFDLNEDNIFNEMCKQIKF